jgi:uncharacterized membrane protein YgcG
VKQAKPRPTILGQPIKPLMLLGLALLASQLFCSFSAALDIPAPHTTVNDFASMIPPASYDELKHSLARFKTQTGHDVVVVTATSLEGESIDSVTRTAFDSLPLASSDLQRAVLFLVARKERQAAVQVGSQLRSLFPQPQASENLQAQVELYIDGMRPDLGIHGAVSHIFKAIRGDIRFDRVTEEERLETASLRGAGAGAIFAILLAPFLSFFVGMAWGVYATQYKVSRETRLFIGGVLGGGTAKIVATLMSMMGAYNDRLWYFILAFSILLAVFASLTEYWMAGEWSGIPREKDTALRRKPTDKMGI